MTVFDKGYVWSSNAVDSYKFVCDDTGLSQIV